MGQCWHIKLRMKVSFSPMHKLHTYVQSIIQNYVCDQSIAYNQLHTYVHVQEQNSMKSQRKKMSYMNTYIFIITQTHIRICIFLTGIICVEGIMGGVGHLDYNCVPSVVYTHPVSGREEGREGGRRGGREGGKKGEKGWFLDF